MVGFSIVLLALNRNAPPMCKEGAYNPQGSPWIVGSLYTEGQLLFYALNKTVFLGKIVAKNELL